MFTLHICARGKVINSVCLFVCQHKNRQIRRTRHLSDSYPYHIHQKIDFVMLRIVWLGPRASQTLCFIEHAYRHYPLQAMYFLLMRAHNPAQYVHNVGKGQQGYGHCTAAALISMQMMQCNVCWVCAVKVHVHVHVALICP